MGSDHEIEVITALPDALTSESCEFPIVAIVADAGERAAKRFYQFFGANIRNKNTRKAYFRAVRGFMQWCEARPLRLEEIEPIIVAGYIEQLQGKLSPPSVNQRPAAPVGSSQTILHWRPLLLIDGECRQQATTPIMS